MNSKFWIVIGCLVLTASIGVMSWTFLEMVGGPHLSPWSTPSRHSAPDLVEVLGNNPIEIEPIPMKVDVTRDPAETARCSLWIASRVVDEADSQARGRILHAARLSSRPLEVPDWLERDELRRVTRVKLAKQSFRRTWRGFEMAENADGKPTEHRDQTLAALAESRVGLDALLESEDDSFQVKDLLRTSLGEFHLGQEEISWTATAYVCYLPPQTSWRNRYGEEFSFDRLAEALMLRSLTKESCGGIHLMLAMTKLLRVDRGMPILDPEVRERLARYLRDKVAEAVASQFGDGSWPLSWSPTGSARRGGEFTPLPDDTTGVTVTGHLLEWFHFLPSDIKPPVLSVKAGTLWVRSKLQSTPMEKIVKNFCPYTHAVVSLELASTTPMQ